MAETVRIANLAEIRRALLTLPQKLRDKELRAATRAAAGVVRDAAIQAAPIDSGDLERNIVATRERSGQHDEDWSVGVRRKAFYWRFIEFGTAKLAARPFLRPAFDNNVQNVITTFRNRLRVGLDRIARRGR